jgi:hypothetical protein
VEVWNCPLLTQAFLIAITVRGMQWFAQGFNNHAKTILYFFSHVYNS